MKLEAGIFSDESGWRCGGMNSRFMIRRAVRCEGTDCGVLEVFEDLDCY